MGIPQRNMEQWSGMERRILKKRKHMCEWKLMHLISVCNVQLWKRGMELEEDEGEEENEKEEEGEEEDNGWWWWNKNEYKQ